jgi:peptidoglycan hydrolase FlgJ
MNGVGFVPGGWMQAMSSVAAGAGAGVMKGAAASGGVEAAATAAATARHAKLADAAQKFEGMLLEQLLKPMQKTQGGGMDDDPQGADGADDWSGDQSLDTMSSYGTEALANAIAKGGGLGIARTVLRQVEKMDDRKQEEKARAGTKSTKV